MPSGNGKRPRTKGDWGTGESKRATVCIEAINQAGQHCYDTGKHFFPGANAIDRDEAFGDRRIKAGGALECRATGVIEKLGPLLTMSAVESKPAEGLGFIPVYSAVLPEVTKMYDLKKFGAVRSAEIDLYAITAERKIPHPAVEAITANGVP